jgi:RimJ/RimL family protein N-acetyltransferase
MIGTQRLIIRKHRESDWKDLHEYLSLAETYEFEPGSPITVKDARKLIQERMGDEVFLAVELKETSKMIGHLYLNQEGPEDFGTWELGYIFNPLYHDHGYCTEACKAVIEYSFTLKKVHRIVGNCNPKNLASWHVLEKCGMRREGFFRKKAFFRKDAAGNPLWHDCYSYSLLEEDFFRHRQESGFDGSLNAGKGMKSV